MGRPYDHYLRFLVTKGLEETSSFNDALEELSLPKVTEEEIDHQYKLVFNTVPKPVQNQITSRKYEGEFRKWMKVLDVNELWDYEKPFRTSEYQYIKLLYDLHSDPRLRLVIGALLIKGVRHEDIVQMVNLKYSSMLKVEHVSLYEKFFWNHRRMTRKEWKNYLADRDSFEKNILFMCFSEDIDTVKAALELPSKTSSSDMLQYMLSQAFQKAKHYLRYNSPDQNMEAREWIKVTMSLSDKYEKHRTGDVEDFGKTLQLEFDYVESEFMTPDEQMLSDVEQKKKENDQRER